MIFWDRWWPMKPLTPRMRMRFMRRGRSGPVGPGGRPLYRARSRERRSGERQRGAAPATAEHRRRVTAMADLELVDTQRAAAATTGDENVAVDQQQRSRGRRVGFEHARAEHAGGHAGDRRRRTGVWRCNGAHEVVNLP